ncbi:hypothetical protein ABBQ32_012433 [Trebouxia sp. C0010 RCD-2024]
MLPGSASLSTSASPAALPTNLNTSFIKADRDDLTQPNTLMGELSQNMFAVLSAAWPICKHLSREMQFTGFGILETFLRKQYPQAQIRLVFVGFAYCRVCPVFRSWGGRSGASHATIHRNGRCSRGGRQLQACSQARIVLSMLWCAKLTSSIEHHTAGIGVGDAAGAAETQACMSLNHAVHAVASQLALAAQRSAGISCTQLSFTQEAGLSPKP